VPSVVTSVATPAPLIAGGVTFVGAVVATTGPSAFEFAAAEPNELEAVTTQRTRQPASAPVNR
jgi:hypothetical protein